MELKIYSQTDEIKLTVSPSDNSTHVVEVMGDNVLNLSFALPVHVGLDVNDYIDFQGERFLLLEKYRPQAKSTVEYQYDVKFFGVQSEIRKALCLKLVEDDLSAEFALTDTAYNHARIVVDNINRIKNSTEWKLGEVIATENLTIEYVGVNCRDALSRIAEAAGTEWWIEGTTVNISKCAHGAPIALAYRHGLTKITFDTSNNPAFFTRLFPLGSTRNIIASDYGHRRLQLPGGRLYVEQNTEYGIIEHYEEAAFAHIYPRRIGTVSNARSEERTGEDGNPFTIYYFRDDTLDFDPNDYEIPGQVKRMVFDSGELLGREFEVNYNSGTKEFEIITTFPYEGIQIPGGVLVPVMGDKYIIFNIIMPEVYYTNAENEFQAAVDQYMQNRNVSNAIYKAPTDYIYIAENNVFLSLGQNIRLTDSRLFPGYYLDTRITKISRMINRPTQMDIEMSDILGTSRWDTVTSDIDTVRHIARQALGGLPDIIRSWESTQPTDSNLFSARKVVNDFLSSVEDDIAHGLIRYLKGLDVGTFSTGVLGSGGTFRMNEQGQSYLEVDKLLVRMQAQFTELLIERLSHIGGQLVISPARMVCSEVEELGSIYRCYFETGENGEFVQEFAVGDQARCQVFTGSTTKYYWRLVTGIGENYIDLSKTDFDGNDIPTAGDHIVQLGNRNDTTRQNAQVLSSFGEDAPSYKQYSGINSYSLEESYKTGFTGKGNKIEGLVNILNGSTGWENLAGLPDAIQEAVVTEVGTVNLLRNTSFSGDFQSIEMEDRELSPDSELFSEALIFWDGEGIVADDPETISGRSCAVTTHIEQQLRQPLMDTEKYILSFKARGVSIKITAGSFTSTLTLSSSSYDDHVVKFTANEVSSVRFEGNFTIADIQLERGTVVSSWATSPFDNNEALARFESIRYMSDAIKGMTQILGGLILTSMIQLGKYSNGVMEEITAGVSGIYNDDRDVAFWAGGTLEQAIKTVMSFADNPTRQLSDEEWTQLANVVITHGGRAILNDAIFRGTVYANSGVFKGRVEANEGFFKGRVEATEGFFTGKMESNSAGNRVVIDPDDYRRLKLITSKDEVVGEFSFYTAGGRRTGRLQVAEFNDQGALGISSLLPGRLELSFGTNYSRITVASGVTIVELNNLPTSNTNLESGMIWRDGETLKIVP